MQQILINLLGNAVKFTARGGVALRAHVAPNAGGGWHVTFDVEDTGPGHFTRRLDPLIQAFEQAEAGRIIITGTGLDSRLAVNWAC